MPFGHATTGATGKQPEILALQKSMGYTPPPAARGGPGAPAGPGAQADWNMEKELLDYVMPYVEKEFRVIKDKNHRAIMGYSMGGGNSTSIGFGHPELFAYVAGFSGYGSAKLLTADPAKANKNYKMIFIGSGTEDTAVNGGRTMHQTLMAAGVNHVWSEDVGYGHDYQIWRQYLHRLLQKTFRD
jgi:enterochelin esterase-like enzyme